MVVALAPKRGLLRKFCVLLFGAYLFFSAHKSVYAQSERSNALTAHPEIIFIKNTQKSRTKEQLLIDHGSVKFASMPVLLSVKKSREYNRWERTLNYVWEQTRELILQVKNKAEPISESEYDKPPFRSAGSISGHSRCTGQLVGDAGVVLTAAHCLILIPKKNGEGTRGSGSSYNDFPSKIEFVRAFRKDRGASGKERGDPFDWSCAALYKGWQEEYNVKWDYAFVKLKRTYSSDFSLASVNSLTSPIQALGYPRNVRNGRQMATEISQFAEINPTMASASRKINTMRDGSSGGAWFDHSNRIYGINAFLKDGNDEICLSPIISKQMLDLYNFVKNGCE